MTTSIDQRVVEARFNNAQFESGIAETLSSLDKLKSGLDLEGASKSVDIIADRFTTLGLVGVAAIQNITNRIVDLSTSMLKSLTVTPLIDGFREYELQMNAVKVMMANLGDKTTMAQVNSALDDLNAYADLTIYNFGAMTDAVGKFTAAGVGLEDSTMAIKGLSNIAAGAGVPAYKMSNAYIQVSQALQAGVFRLQDWNSLQNAGLANEEFRNKLLANAKAIDGFTLGSNNFRESLKDGWLTTEVFLATMGEATDETDAWGKRLYAAATEITTFSQLVGTLKEAIGTGWGDTLKLLIGDFEEAKALWTDVGDVLTGLVGAFSDSRNEVLKFWKANDGRTIVIEGIANAFIALGQVLKPIGEAFQEAFPAISGKRLVELSESFRALTERFKMEEETIDNIKRTFAGLFAVLDIGAMGVKTVIGIVGDALSSLLSIVVPGASGLLGFTAAIGDFFVSLRNGAESAGVFKEIGNSIGEVFTSITDAIKGFVNIDLSPINDFSNKVEIGFKPITNIFDGISSGIKKLGGVLAKAFEWLADKLGAAVAGMDINGVLGLINTGLLGGVLFGIKKFTDSLSKISTDAGGLLDSVKGILDGVRGSLEAYQQNLKAKTLLTIAGAIALLAGSVLVLSTIDSGKMASSLSAITVLFVELTAVLMVLSKQIFSVKMTLIASQMIFLSTAVLILSAAMKNIADLDWDDILKGVAGIAAMSAILVKASDALSKSSPRLIAGSVGLIAFSAAMLILTQSVKQIGDLNTTTLTKGLTGVAIMLAEIVLFLKVANLETIGVGSAIALIALAAALKIMASAVGDFGSLDVKSLAKGLGAMAIVLGELAIFTKLINPVGVMSVSVAMLALGASMLIFAKAIGEIGKLDMPTIGKGLLGMAGSLAIVVGAVKMMPKNMVATGVGLIGISTALVILGKALSSMGGMSVQEIAKGLSALGGSLLIITLAVSSMTGGLAGAAAMLVMSTAIGVLVPSLILLGAMDIRNIGTALLALAGTFAVIGGAAVILAPVVPLILALAASIVLLGAGTLAIGAGLALFATGLSALTIAGSAGVAVLISIVTSLINMIPMAAAKLAEGLIEFTKVLAKGAPDIMNSVATLITEFIKTITEHIPQMVTAGIQFLKSLMEGIAENIQDVVILGLKIVSEFLTGVANGIPGIVTAGVDIIVAFLDSIGKEAPRIIDAGYKMIIDFINGLSKAIEENTQPLIDACKTLGGSIIDGIVAGLGMKPAIDAIKEVGSGMLQGFKDVLGIASPSKEAIKASKEVVNGLVVGMRSTDPKKAAENLAKGIKDGLIGNPGVFKGIGETQATEFLKGLSNKEIKAKAIGEIVALAAEQGIKVNIKELNKAGVEAGQAYIDGLNAKAKEEAKRAGEYVVNRLIAGLQSSDPAKAATNLSQAIKDGLSLHNFTGIGETKATDFLKGLSGKEIEAKAVAELVALATKAGIEFNIEDFEAAGEQAGQAYIDGLNSKLTAAEEMANKISSIAISGGYYEQSKKELADRRSGAAMGLSELSKLTDAQAEVYWKAGGGASGTAAVKAANSVGKNVGNSLANGLSSTTKAVSDTAKKVASGAVSAIKNVLKIHSPSEVTTEFGEFTGLGFINGLIAMTSKVANASEDIGTEAMNGLKSAISMIADVASVDLDYAPVIRPVIDFDNVQNGINQISKMFSKENEMAVQIASEIGPTNKSSINTDTPYVRDDPDGHVVFQQFNNSPKALSRTEIYRDTKNLISIIKERVVPT